MRLSKLTFIYTWSFFSHPKISYIYFISNSNHPKNTLRSILLPNGLL